MERVLRLVGTESRSSSERLHSDDFIRFLNPFGCSIATFIDFERMVSGRDQFGIVVSTSLNALLIPSFSKINSFIISVSSFINEGERWQFTRTTQCPFSTPSAMALRVILPWPCPSWIIWRCSFFRLICSV